MLSDDQIAELKTQLRQQVQHLPADKKAAAEAQIDSMSADALETMLEEQKTKGSDSAENKGIFRRIVDGDVPSVKVTENRVASAYMDINPVSRGHIIILPKKAVDNAKKLPTSAFALAKKLASKITSKLGASSTEIQTENKFGEACINVIPVYDKPVSINSPKSIAKMDELEQIAILLRPKPRKVVPKVIKIEKPAQKETAQKPRRIP
jgi:histidine triad (HIT) family protein